MITLKREILNEIMATDVFIALSSETYSESEIKQDIDTVVAMFKEFEAKFSRFKPDSELSILNKLTESPISEELCSILIEAQEYYQKTNGIFDPSILNALIKEGYAQSKKLGFVSTSKNINDTQEEALKDKYKFSDVKINVETKTLVKPKELQIDLGGIGKGFIIDKISNFLKSKNYNDFCVDAGGDMYLAGKDIENKYNYWAIELEDPFLALEDKRIDISVEFPTLIISNKAIATSGTNKRRWLYENKEKNHIINPQSATSLINELICTTVIGDYTVFADIMAKVLLIKGTGEGMKYCNENNIAGIFVTKTKEIYFSDAAQKYVWHE